MKSYLITDSKYYSNNVEEFRKKLKKIYDYNKVDFSCFRDKESKNFEELAKIFLEVSKQKNIKNIFLNTNYLLANELKFYGVHLNSKQFKDINNAKNLGLKTIISCHCIDDINLANYYKADYVTYSPIYFTPNKDEPKGIDNLKNIVKIFKKTKIFALGGITSNTQIEEIKTTNVFGFASIRYFTKD